MKIASLVLLVIMWMGVVTASAEPVDVWVSFNEVSWKTGFGPKAKSKYFPFGTFGETERDCQDIQQNITAYDTTVGTLIAAGMGMYKLKATSDGCTPGVLMTQGDFDELITTIEELMAENQRLRGQLGE